jgi:FlaA1/EpsC-like NDP-sugar epimerase
MTSRLKNFKFYIELLADAIVFVTALIGAYLLLFQHPIAREYVRQMMALAPVIVLAKVAVFSKFGLYRGLSRNAFDLWHLAKDCLISMLLASAYAFFFMSNLSRSVLILDGILTFMLISTLRVGNHSFYMARTNPEGFKK